MVSDLKKPLADILLIKQLKKPKPIIITNVFSVQYHLSCRMTETNPKLTI